MKQLLLTISLFIIVRFSFGQTNYLDKGNQQLNDKDYAAAEQTFREAIKSDSSNLIYHNQLALALLDQKKYAEAQKSIDKVLSIDSTNVGALWYGGMNNFLDENADLRKAIEYFEMTLSLLKETQAQFYSANWFIGRSYEILLQTDGLTYNEVTKMLDCYTTYIRLKPLADDAATITAFVKHIKEIRPSDNVEKWINQYEK